MGKGIGSGHDFALDRGDGPGDLTVLGTPPGGGEPAGYYQCDRALHTHVIGHTGSGKSSLLESVALQDIRAGRGGLFIDPHGDSARRVAAAVPAGIAESGTVVYLDFGADAGCLATVNPFEVADVTSAESRQVAVDRAADLVLRAARIENDSARLAKYVRKGLMALAFVPESDGSVRGGATLLDLMPLFTDGAFRSHVMGHVTDRSLKSWWDSFGNMCGSKALDEAMALEGRLGLILGDPRLAEVLGGSRSTVDLADAMDAGRYVIVSLGRASNSATFRQVVGSALVTQAYAAGLGRQCRMGEPDRRRFHVVVDEFHNFVTESFDFAIEECRKYGIDFTLSHQTMGQLDGEPGLVKTLETNVANRVAFGVGPTDAATFARYMPNLTPADLVGLPTHHVAAQLMMAGRRGLPASTLVTLPPELPADAGDGLLSLCPEPGAGGLHANYVPSEADFGDDAGEYAVIE